MEEVDKNTDSEGYGYGTSVNDENNIVGNDSFEYNKAMLTRRPHITKKAIAMAFNVENIADELLPREINDTISDYSAHFENGANFLTSTVNDEIDCSIQRVDVSDALCKISAVEMKVSSFVNEIMNDLKNSKEILRQIENRGGSSVQQSGKANSDKGNHL